MSASSQDNVLRLRLQGAVYADESIIRFVEGATDDFDGDYDAWKLFSFNPNVPAVYTELDSLSPLSINSLPALFKKRSVDIYVRVNDAGNYTITPSMLYSFAPGACVVLEDIHSGQVYSMTEGQPVNFFADAPAPSGMKRFRAHFSIPAELTITAASCFNAADGGMHITKRGFSSWNYSVLSDSGISVLNGTASSDDLDISGMEQGTYYVTAVSPYGCPDTIIAVVDAPAAIDPSFHSPDSVNLSMAVIQFENTTQGGDTYLWDFGDGSPYSTELAPMHYYAAPGTYTVSLTAFSGSCSEALTRTLTVLDDQVATGISDAAANTLLRIWASGHAIAMESAGGEPVQVTVFSALGQQVAASRVQPGERVTSYPLKPGCYFINITTGGIQQVEKLVIKGE